MQSASTQSVKLILNFDENELMSLSNKLETILNAEENESSTFKDTKVVSIADYIHIKFNQLKDLASKITQIVQEKDLLLKDEAEARVALLWPFDAFYTHNLIGVNHDNLSTDGLKFELKKIVEHAKKRVLDVECISKIDFNPIMNGTSLFHISVIVYDTLLAIRDAKYALKATEKLESNQHPKDVIAEMISNCGSASFSPNSQVKYVHISQENWNPINFCC